MLVVIDTNEGTDREKNHVDQYGRPDRDKRTDSANVRAVARLKKYFKNLQETPLSSGDINVILDGGKVLAIERKRCGDFLGSIGNGRIFRQVENMAKNATWSCIMIEGLISFDQDDMAVITTYDKQDRRTGTEETQWKGVSVRGAMYAIQWSGCPIITIEPEQLPNVIVDLANFCAKPMEHYQSMGRHRYVTFPPLTITEEIIASFPGVGTKRTRSLMKFSKELNDNKVATLAETLAWGSNLDKIHKKSRPEGWGDIVVTNFRGTLGLDQGEYLDIKQENPKKQVKGKQNGK